MFINSLVLDRVEASGKKLLAVTKYFSVAELEAFQEYLLSQNVVIALGENRIDSIIEKNIPRERCHFIGNIQSRNIADISKKCSVVHSLCQLSHAQKFSKQSQIPDFFIQINVSDEPQKGGLNPNELGDFLSEIPKNLNILGLSAIGSYSANMSAKQKEFDLLNSLRKKFNLNWKISAGTSVDYKLALQNGVDIVRVGRKLFEADYFGA